MREASFGAGAPASQPDAGSFKQFTELRRHGSVLQEGADAVPRQAGVVKIAELVATAGYPARHAAGLPDQADICPARPDADSGLPRCLANLRYIGNLGHSPPADPYMWPLNENDTILSALPPSSAILNNRAAIRVMSMPFAA